MIKTLDDWLEFIVKWLLVICVFSMLGLTLVNITLRAFDTAFHWIDPFVRHLVFFSAFLGGCLATGANLHIKMDLLSKLLEKRAGNIKKYIELIVVLSTFGACLVLTYACYEFTLSELRYGRESFLGIHSGALVSLSVIGFGLISTRTLFKSCLLFKELK